MARVCAAFAALLALLALLALVAVPTTAFSRQTPAATHPPVIFVHGNGDHAGLWDATIWRFESNGYPADRLFAVDLPNPVAQSTLSRAEPNRSSPEDQTAALAAFVTRVLLRTGASQVVLVGSSRGGMTIRNYLRFGGGSAVVSHAILCGTPNHGVFNNAALQPDSEFNGTGPYLSALNAGSEVVDGVQFLTIRSDSLDKFAQADGAGLGMPGIKTGVDATGPALAGADDVVLDGLDHREVAFHARAFDATYRFLTGDAPATREIRPDTVAVLDGLVSRNEAGAPTNLPTRGATVTVYAVNATTGARVGDAQHRQVTTADGRWGPFVADPRTTYEFEVAAADSSVILHVYRTPIPRGSRYVNFRLPAPVRANNDSVSVLLIRPRGYLGVGRDTVEVNGRSVSGIPPGVPSADRALVWFPADSGRAVATRLNGERITVRTQVGDPRRLVVAEFGNE